MGALHNLDESPFVLGSALNSTRFRVPVYEQLAAAALVLVLIPIWWINLGLALLQFKNPIKVSRDVDALGRQVKRRRFSAGLFKRSLLLISVLQGRLSFVGISFTAKVSKPQARFYSLAPGLISLYDIHSRIGLSEISHEDLIIEQMAKSGLVARAKIVLLGIISALFYSDSVCQSPRLLSIFGIRIDNVTMAEAVDWITANDHVGPTQIGYFVNVNSVNIAYENSEFKAELAQADRVFADGSGVRLAVSKSGNRLKDNVNGTDLLPQLCKKLVKTGKSVYLLGAAPGVAEQAAKSLMLQFPGLNIAGCQHGYFSEDQNQDVIEHINASRADVLLVAFGSPKQEHWLASNRELLSIPCALAVGGLFDFFSGNVSRAPHWMRMIGFEWVWRLLQEPSRMWKRYILGNPLFLFRTFFMKKELMQ